MPKFALALPPADVAAFKASVSHLDPSTAEDYANSILRLVASLGVRHGGEVKPDSLLVSCFTSGALDDLFKTALWAPERTRAIRLSGALKHFDDWHVDRFRRSGDAGAVDAVALL